MKPLNLLGLCVAVALLAITARAVIDTYAWVVCMNHGGGLTCRIFKADAGMSWAGVSTLALGIAFRQSP